MAAATTTSTATAGTGARRDADQASASNAPTAKFLQARIDTLRNTLVSRLENIFASAMDDTADSTTTAADNNTDAAGPGTGADVGSSVASAPPLTDTAAKQLSIDVEASALIRAAEEIFVLTRTMKEVWLFGGLDTLTGTNGTGAGGIEDEDVKEGQRKTKEDESQVVKGLLEFLATMDRKGGNGDGGTEKREQEQNGHGDEDEKEGDVDMDDDNEGHAT